MVQTMKKVATAAREAMAIKHWLTNPSLREEQLLPPDALFPSWCIVEDLVFADVVVKGFLGTIAPMEEFVESVGFDVEMTEAWVESDDPLRLWREAFAELDVTKVESGSHVLDWAAEWVKSDSGGVEWGDAEMELDIEWIKFSSVAVEPGSPEVELDMECAKSVGGEWE